MSFIEKMISDLFTSKELCDVTLIVGEEKKPFPTHKFLLSFHSDVFKAMFFGPMAEKKSEIFLPEDNPEILDIVLRYIYTNEFKIKNLDDCILAYIFTEKYMITRMRNICITQVERFFHIERIIKYYEEAVALQKPQLINKCWKFIKENTYEIIKHESFTNAKFKTVLDIISEDILTLNTELDIYNAIVKWGKENFQENDPHILREKIFPLLQQVRFISMTNIEFSGSPCMDELLTKHEQLAIFREMSNHIEEDSILEKQWRKKRIFSLYSPCCLPLYVDIPPSFILLKKMLDNCITIKARFRATQQDLNVWGVSLQVNIKFKMAPCENPKAIINLSIKNSFKKSERTIEVFFRGNQDYNERETISVLLEKPITVLKGERFKVFFSFNTQYFRPNIIDINCCEQHYPVYSKLELLDYENYDFLPHLTAVLVSTV